MTFCERQEKALSDRSAKRNPLLAKPLQITAWQGSTAIYLTKATQDWRARCNAAREAMESVEISHVDRKRLETTYFEAMAN